MKTIKQFLPLIILSVLSVVTIAPFLNSGFFPIHDNTQVQRVYEMTKSLREGMLPVRWVADLGYGFGYPIFNFYAPFAYYVGGFINLVVVDALLATKIMMALGILLSGFSMYFLAKEIWGKTSGLFSALLFLFAPYHALNIFVRGDVAEFYAYAFLPLIFYCLIKVYRTNSKKYVYLGGIFYACLIISHNLTAFMVTPFILVFLIYLWFRNKKTNPAKLLLTIAFGLLLSAFYWIPALLEMHYTDVLSQVGGGADYKDHFVCLTQLWSSSWGFGGSIKGCVDGLSFMLGKLHIILAVSTVLLFIVLAIIKKINLRRNYPYIFLFLALIFSIFLTLNYSKFIWDIFAPMAIFQYPWRFLLLATFFVSLISGGLIYLLKILIKDRRIVLVISALLIVLIVVFNAKYFKPQVYLNQSLDFYINNNFLKFTSSQISSEYMPKNFDKPKSFIQISDKVLVKKGKAVIHSYKIITNLYQFDYSADNSIVVLIPRAYFPAWKGYLDNSKIALTENRRGIIVSLPKGKHRFTLKFEQTPIEVAANIISLSGILALFVDIIYQYKKRK